MNFDTSMVMDYIVPDSPSDFGAILLWVLIIVLVIILIIDTRLYLNYRKTPNKMEKPQQKFTTLEQMKKSKEGRMQELDDIRKKVDKILEVNKL